MALAQQISCLVAAKCTSMLQITDSDFSKQFKSLVRKELKELRLEFQQRTKGNSVFKVCEEWDPGLQAQSSDWHP